jgi:hypothetical protein
MRRLVARFGDHKLLHRASVGKTECADYHIHVELRRSRSSGCRSVVYPFGDAACTEWSVSTVSWMTALGGR